MPTSCSEALEDICESSVCACRVASRWHLDSLIVGQTSVKQLEEYLRCFDVTLDEETLQEIERIHRENRCPQWAD
jgi:aryl-alcohol dehydrogenase-like predicted oxidoreductase